MGAVWRFSLQPRRLISLGIRIADYIRFAYVHDGERVSPHFPDGNFINHFKAYKFAAQLCRGVVLDIGCGTGYGTDHLAEYSKKIIGIDYSKAALRFARNRYRASNLEFVLMNAESLEFPDRTFDFIISTENFEHLPNQSKAAGEMARVLKPEGFCLLATPNPEAFVSVPPNPHHTHELTFDELKEVFTPLFKDVEILENSLTPKQSRGIIANGSLTVFGKSLDITHLSNTHSFFCFLKNPNYVRPLSLCS